MPKQDTVLVVDDDPAVLEMTAQFLQKLGYVAYTAASGAEAVKQCERLKESLFVVLIDWKMPGMDGVQTAGAIKKVCPDAKLILFSGYDAYSVYSENKGLFRTFLKKPFGAAEIVRTLQCMRQAP